MGRLSVRQYHTAWGRCDDCNQSVGEFWHFEGDDIDLTLCESCLVARLEDAVEYREQQADRGGRG